MLTTNDWSLFFCLAGVVAGDCIFGDADCNMDPGSMNPAVKALFIYAEDYPVLQESEYFYFAMDFFPPQGPCR